MAVAGASVAVVALLGVGVHSAFGPQLRLDRVLSVALYVGDDRSRVVEALLDVVTALGSSVVRLALAVPVLVLLVRRRAWSTGLWVVFTVVLIGPLTLLCKRGFGRPRPPFAAAEGLHKGALSFPSGHASGIATLVTVGLLLAWPLLSTVARRAWLGIGAVLVLTVGLTRMWLGVHFMTDVVAGWALGLGWPLFTALLIGALPGGRAALRHRP